MRCHKVSMVCLMLTVLVGCDAGQKNIGGEAPATDTAKDTGIATTVTKVDAASLPPEVVNVVMSAVPGMQIEGAERKEREDRVYYDVEGRRSDGSEVELDVLQEGSNYQVVEIQRDLSWSEAPEAARAAAAASEKTFEPVRVIESTQTDGSVIYELFAQGKPDKPALEVRVADGKAEVLKEEWMH
jgi:hypothetical protein